MASTSPTLPAGWPDQADVPELEHRTDLPAGFVAPAPITVGYLTSGSSDPIVVDLGRDLDALGFPNSASRGENPYGSLDVSVLAAVHSFRAKYGIVEPPADIFGGDTPGGALTAANHVGPVTMNAIRLEAAKLAYAAQ